ncbi:MAG: flagellar type III secretion system pore protein FliP [Vampirovibrionales bacterium]|jgi:flagellar biosynthetic protein FliP
MLARQHWNWGLGLAIVLMLVAMPMADAAGVALPTIQLGVAKSNSPEQVAQGVQILILLTVLTLAPSILVMTTAFTRIVIVLSLVRQALGTPTLPPSQVIVSLAMILSFFVMAPTFEEVNKVAFEPFMKGRMSVDVALEKATEPMRTFMFKQTSEKDMALFTKLAKIKKPKTTKDVPTYVLLPSFIISELKTAFQLGFVLFLPFIVIDIVVSSILVSMGMMFLPPVTISLPFKLILFVLVDGWHLISQSLVMGFR